MTPDEKPFSLPFGLAPPEKVLPQAVLPQPVNPELVDPAWNAADDDETIDPVDLGRGLTAAQAQAKELGPKPTYHVANMVSRLFSENADPLEILKSAPPALATGIADIGSTFGQAAVSLGRYGQNISPMPRDQMLSKALEHVGLNVRELYESEKAYWRSKFTPEAVQAQANPEQYPIAAITLGALESSPSTAAMYAIAAPLAPLIKSASETAQLGSALSKYFKPETVKRIMDLLPSTASSGIAEGIYGGFSNAAEAAEEVRNLPDHILFAHPYARRAFLATDEKLPIEDRLKLARDAVSRAVETDVALSTGFWDTLTGMLGSGGILGSMQRDMRGSAIKAILKDIQQEAKQELIQSGGERFLANLAAREHYDKDRSLMDNVVQEALIGGGAGGLMAGGISAGRATVRQVQELRDPRRRIERLWDEWRDDLATLSATDQSTTPAPSAVTSPVALEKWERVRNAPVADSSNPALRGLKLEEFVNAPDPSTLVGIVGFELPPSLTQTDSKAAAYDESLRKARAYLLKRVTEWSALAEPGSRFIVEDMNLRELANDKKVKPLIDFPATSRGHFYRFKDATGRISQVIGLNGNLWARAFDPSIPWTQRRKLRQSLDLDLVHEMYHSLASQHYDSLPKEAKAALHNDWLAIERSIEDGSMSMDRWLKTAVSASRAQNIRALMKRTHIPEGAQAKTAFLLMENALTTQHDMSPQAAKRRIAYLRSFQEWVAEQGVRHAEHQGTATPTPSVFDQLLRPLRNLWQRVNGRYTPPTKTFARFARMMRSMSELNRDLEKTFSETSTTPPDTPDELSSKLFEMAKNSGSNIISELGLTEKDRKEEAEHFSKLMRYGFTLLQIADRFKHVQPLQEYVSNIRDFMALVKRWGYRANERVGQIKELGRDADPVFKLLAAESAGEGTILPGSPEWKEIFGSHTKTLTDAQQDLYTNIRADFMDMLGEWERLEIAKASDIYANDKLRLEAEVKRIRGEYDAMRSKNYFPQSRFGKYYVRVIATAKTTWRGHTYRKNDVLWREHTYTKRDAMALRDELKRETQDNPDIAVSFGEIDKSVVSFAGLPSQFLEFLSTQLNLTDSQQEQLREMRIKYASQQSFRKHFMRKRNIGGWSEDGLRQYANYFFFAPIHLAKATYRPALQRHINAIAESANQRARQGLDTDARDKLHAWLTRHLDYVMNPESEYVFLRQLGFFAFLGFMTKSAAVNLTQVPIFTYAHLAGTFGDAKSAKAITQAYKDLIRRWKIKDPTLDNHPYSMELQEALSLARLRGAIDESLAAYIAGLAEANAFERLLPGTRAGQSWQQLLHYSAYMFQAAEAINREVTFVAAWRLATQEGYSPQQAFDYAVDAIDRTQGEYARWNRPELFRGLGAPLFLFKMYVQLVLYFMFGGSPGWWRAWLILFILGGYRALPFMENALDLVEVAMNFLSKDKKTARKMVRDFMDDAFARTLTPNAGDYFEHGLFRNTFGLGLDLSGSLSMGRILPGTDAIRTWKTSNDPSSAILYAEKEALGPIFGYPLGVLAAAMSNDPNSLRQWSRVSPNFVGSALEAYDILRQGGYVTRNNVVLWKHDIHDPIKNLQLTMRMLGFPITELNRERDRMRLIEEHVAYWTARREQLTTALHWARQRNNREGIADAMNAIRRYNRERPVYAPPITKELVENSIKQRERTRALQQKYGVRSPREIPISRHLFPEPSPAPSPQPNRFGLVPAEEVLQQK